MNGTTGTKGPLRPEGGTEGPQGRAARLKAALKANMARRKAQARARSGAAEETTDPDPDTDGQQQDG